jgi:2-polyprenyl-3-methyl-5-hydroxy-6-metoxy-1,4-benzoquinol methylase
MESTKEHWEKVYLVKQANELSWTQEVPKTSLEFIHSFNLSKTAKIIDVGGGDSKLVDYLLNEGFIDITVLDISANAIERAKKRLSNRSQKVKWIVSDVTEFEPATDFDLWHDRATFHFLTTGEQVAKYADIAKRCVKGYLIIGTFSENGPKKCSGLFVKQYSEERLHREFKNEFEKIRCITEDHVTPFNTIQSFLFCSFKRRIKDQR